METPNSPLSEEIALFEERRKDWTRSHQGEFVVIQDGIVLPEFFKSFEDAFRAGVKAFGPTRNFLVKQIWLTDPTYLIS